MINIPPIIDNKKPPITPEYVLFGLTFVNFGPLNNLPKKYPPKSVRTEMEIAKRKKVKICEKALATRPCPRFPKAASTATLHPRSMLHGRQLSTGISISEYHT